MIGQIAFMVVAGLFSWGVVAHYFLQVWLWRTLMLVTVVRHDISYATVDAFVKTTYKRYWRYMPDMAYLWAARNKARRSAWMRFSLRARFWGGMLLFTGVMLGPTVWVTLAVIQHGNPSYYCMTGLSWLPYAVTLVVLQRANQRLIQFVPAPDEAIV